MLISGLRGFSYLLRSASLAPVIVINQNLKDEIQHQKKSEWWAAKFLALLAILISFYAYNSGLDRKMHLVTPDSVDALSQAIGVVISEKFFGTEGYVGRMEVIDTLWKNGFTSRPWYHEKLGIKSGENIWMPELNNTAIQRALELQNLPENASIGNRLLYVPTANDPGYIDLIRLGFEIYGYNIQSLYYFYWLVFSISVGIFIFNFRNQVLPMSVLVLFVIAHLTILESPIFSYPSAQASVHNQRFLGSLAIVPLIHLLFSTLIYRKYSAMRLLATASQVVILCFMLYCRSSVIWMVGAFFMIAAFKCIVDIGSQTHEIQPTKLVVKTLVSWPVILLTLGLISVNTYKNLTVSSIYGFDGVFISKHMVWHNAYMGLAVHPSWNELFGDEHKNANGDSMVWNGTTNLLSKKYGLPEEYALNQSIGKVSFKKELHEQLAKEALFDFIGKNPRFTLELYLWHKPKEFIKTFLHVQSPTITLLKNWEFYAFLALFAMFISTFVPLLPISGALSAQWSLFIVITTAVLSLLPVFWTYPLPWVSGVPVLMWTMALLYLTLITFSLLLSFGLNCFKRLIVVRTYASKKKLDIIPLPLAKTDQKPKKTLTILVACYNEESHLADTFKNIKNAVTKSNLDDYEVIIINDASSDQTGHIADEIASNNDKVTVIHNHKNQGFGSSLSHGIKMSAMNFMVVLPGDNEISSESVDRIVDSTGLADIVAPYTVNTEVRTPSRRFLSQAFTLIMNSAFRLDVHYYNGPSVHRVDLLKTIGVQTNGFAFQSMITTKLLKMGYSICEIPMHIQEKAGYKSTALRISNVFDVVKNFIYLWVQIKAQKELYTHRGKLVRVIFTN